MKVNTDFEHICSHKQLHRPVAEDKLPVQVNAAKNDRCAAARREVEPTMKQWSNQQSLALVKGGERRFQPSGNEDFQG